MVGRTRKESSMKKVAAAIMVVVCMMPLLAGSYVVYRNNSLKLRQEESLERLQRFTHLIRFSDNRAIKLTFDKNEMLEHYKVPIQNIEHFQQPVLADADLGSLQGLFYLESLNLADTDVSDIGMEQVAAFRHLRELSLVRTQISANGLAHLRKLRALRALRIDSHLACDVGLVHLKHVARLENVEIICDEGAELRIREGFVKYLPHLTVTVQKRQSALTAPR